tara:strand:+ start:41 stop:619 length:579 start_codon:yes stop_codon:yes gene_type:complete
MRIIIISLVLVFNLQSWTKANDLRDFVIEGMSIGDSLLDYFSEEDIKNKEKNFYPGSDKYYIIAFEFADFYETYEVTQFVLKSNDEKYIIHSVSGKLIYDNKFSECNKKKDLIGKEISQLFDIEPQINNGDILKSDSTGKSISNSISFFFDNGDQIMIDCSDWSEAMNFYDNLKLVILPNYVNQWLLDEAFK